jgi:hypothetical protein
MRPADVRDHIEGAFVSEPADSAWARTAEHTIETRFASALPARALRSVECHTSMCRIETLHESIDAYQAFYRKLASPESMPWLGPIFSTALDEAAAKRGDAFVIVSFLAREGRELPRPN